MTHNETDLRAHQLGLLARELRRQLEWQSELGLVGGLAADADHKKQVTQALNGAQRRRDAQLAEQLRGPAEPRPQATRPKKAVSEPQERPQRMSTRQITRSGSSFKSLGGGSASLDEIRADLGDCKRCKLCTRRRNIVFGVGNPHADLVFVGEAPGFNEDKTGVPFVGAAGQLLDKMIGAMGYSRDTVYICNVIKCRPSGNRDPEPDELETCEPFLVRQLASIKPKCIVTLGRYASQALLRSRNPITRIRGQWGTYQGVALMPTFHPAYLLRNPAQKRLVWNDLQQVIAFMKGEHTGPA